MSIFIFIWFA